MPFSSDGPLTFDDSPISRLVHATFEAIDDAILIVRFPDRTVRMCNAAATEMLGYRRDELVGAKVDKLHVDSERAEQFNEEVVSRLENGASFRTELPLRRSDGSTIPTEQLINFIGGERADGVRHVVNLVRDVSERKQRERDLQVLEATSEAIADAAGYRDALEETLARLGEHVGWEYGEAWVAPESFDEDGVLELAATWCSKRVDDDRRRQLASFIETSRRERFERGEGLQGVVWASREPEWIPNVARSSSYRRADQAESVGFRTVLAVPVVRDDEPVAVLIWYAPRKIDRDATTVLLGERVSEDLGAFLQQRDIETELRRESDRFQMLAENVAEVFWMSTPKKDEMLYINPAYERIWGRSSEELLEHPESWLEAVHPEDRNRVARALPEQIEGTYDEEYRIVRPDGTVRWIHDRAYPIVRYGEVYRIVGIAQDVTERKRTEEKLRESERKFATAFRENPVAMMLVSLKDETILDINDAFTELTGFQPSEAVMESLDRLELWVDALNREELERRLANDSRIREFETRIWGSEGDERDVRVSGRAVRVAGEACFLATIRDVTRQNEYEAELEFRALYDELTDLPNRNLYRNRLEHALTRAGTVAVVTLDIDRFKVVNDSLGHSAGDKLLEEVAERLSGAVSEDVTVARVGADEFALLFEDVGMEALEDRCRQLTESVSAPIQIDGTRVHPTFSTGIAVRTESGRTAEDLLRYANIALSKAKSADGNSVARFDRDDDTRETERLQRENALRRAVDDRQFVVHYQPVVHMRTGELVGAEALVRWRHPDRGVVSPGEFIELAEQTGLIVPMGYQVLEQSFRDAVEWFDRSSEPDRESRFRLSVNLSVRQYREADLVRRVRSIADDTEFPLDRLVLEITESILATGQGRLEELRDAGARVSIDDFGTGYSSLQYLRRLEADELKIDRSYVADLAPDTRERTLIDGILRMSQQMGLDVVAEGIETDDQMRQLTEMGATFGQGYYFARPMTAEAFVEDWIQSTDE